MTRSAQTPAGDDLKRLDEALTAVVAAMLQQSNRAAGTIIGVAASKLVAAGVMAGTFCTRSYRPAPPEKLSQRFLVAYHGRTAATDTGQKLRMEDSPGIELAVHLQHPIDHWHAVAHHVRRVSHERWHQLIHAPRKIVEGGHLHRKLVCDIALPDFVFLEGNVGVFRATRSWRDRSLHSRKGPRRKQLLSAGRHALSKAHKKGRRHEAEFSPVG
ncbi:hypothetical protein PVT71_00290 [Salipiger sp. H15]|uniref:Uncharacterized protein n=1 Tax=Alloyangia sp. H15 TaxID=3029062 RepID=A0AAU8AG14_9RHOB